MNKEKVIGLSNRLNSIVDEANRHPNGNPGHITWSKVVYAIECLSKEVNSKPLMPEVFDDWYKSYGGCEQDTCYLLLDFNDMVIGQKQFFDGDVQIVSDEDVKLFDWLYEGKLFDYSKYLMCIDAIINGYEVEK